MADPLRKPTMKDVADRAKVSPMTVSYALRHDPRITEGTRARVLRAAEALGYKPNPLVAALMSQRKGGASHKGLGTLAVLVRHAQIIAKQEQQFLLGAPQRAEERGYELAYFQIDPEGKNGPQLSRVLRARGIQGVLIPRLGRSMALDMDWKHFAVVSQGYTLVEPGFHRVASDLYRGALQAVDRLRALGYRRIGLAILEESSRQTQDLWLAAFVVRQRGWPACERLEPLLFSRHDWRLETKNWIEKERPDVILHSHVDLTPLLDEMGLKAPHDVGLAHLDLNSGNTLHAAGMAGIDQRWEANGAALVDVLVARLHANDRGIPAIPRVTLIEGTWVMGQTVRLQAPRSSCGRQTNGGEG